MKRERPSDGEPRPSSGTAPSTSTTVRAEFARFVLVGAAAFAVDASTLYLLIGHLGLNPYVGRLGSYLTAVTFSWAVNRAYTFRDRQRDTNLQREWAKFSVMNSLGGLINYATYAGLIATSVLVASHPILGVAAGSVAGLAVNFTLSRYFVFTHKRP